MNYDCYIVRPLTISYFVVPIYENINYNCIYIFQSL